MRHDSQLFAATINSIDESIDRPRNQKIPFDSAYDSVDVRTGLFNNNYLSRIIPNKRNSKETKVDHYPRAKNALGCRMKPFMG